MRFSFTSMFALAILAAATSATEVTVTTTVTETAPAPTTTAGGNCNVASQRCCESVQKASEPTAQSLLGVLGVVVQDVNALVGISCSPITVIGVGGDCKNTPVCCENNSWGSLISIGCIVISV